MILYPPELIQLLSTFRELRVNLAESDNISNEVAVISTIMAKSGLIADIRHLQDVCRAILSMENENKFDFESFFQKVPHFGLKDYASLLEFVICSVVLKTSFSVFEPDLSKIDEIVSSHALTLYSVSQIVCCFPRKISLIRQILGVEKFSKLLLSMTLLDHKFYGSDKSERDVKKVLLTVLCQVLRKFGKNANLTEDCFIWPIICSLNSKKSQIREASLQLCEVLRSSSEDDETDNDQFLPSILDIILDQKQELIADHKQLKTVINSICNSSPNCLESLISSYEACKTSTLESQAIPILLSSCENPLILKLLSATLKENLKKNITSNEHLCCEIIRVVNRSNFEKFVEPIALALNVRIPPAIVEATLNVLSPQLFSSLEPAIQHDLFARLIILRKDGAKFQNLKESIDKLPVTSKMLKKCVGLPEYDLNAKPRRSRVDSFTSNNIGLDKVRMFLDFVCDREFVSKDVREVVVTINALIMFLERSYISNDDDAKSEYENAIIMSIGVLKDFITRYPSSEDILETELLLGLIKRFDDVNIKGQCFDLLTTNYQRVYQNNESEAQERAIRIFTAICDSLSTREDEFSFRLIVSSVKKLLLPLLQLAKKKASSLREFLAFFVTALKTQSSERQILLINACINPDDFDKNGYFWQLVLDFFMNSFKGAEVQTSILVVAQVCNEYPIGVSLNLMIKLLNACEYFLDKRNVKELQSIYKLTPLKTVPEKVKRFTVVQILSLIPVVVHSSNFVYQLTNLRLNSHQGSNELFRNILSQIFALQTCKTLKQVNHEAKSLLSPNERIEMEFAKTVDLKLKESLAAADVLFDDALFFEVFSELLNSEQDVNILRSLEFLNIRISRPGSEFLSKLTKDQINNLYDLVLTHILHDNDRICQYVLVTLLKLMRVFPAKVNKIAQNTAQLMQLKGSVCNIRIQICTILAELIKSMKQAFLPFFPKVINFVLDFEACKKFADKMLFDSVLFCLSVIFESFSGLLGPYLTDICSFLINISEFEVDFKLKNEISAISEKLVNLQMRVLLPVFNNVVQSFFLNSSPSFDFLMKARKLFEIVKFHFEKNSRSEIEANQIKSHDLLLQFLEMRQLIFSSNEPQTSSISFEASKNQDPEQDVSLSERKRKKRRSEISGKRSKTQFSLSEKLETFFNSEEFLDSEAACFEPFIEFVLKNSESVVRFLLAKVSSWAFADEKLMHRRVITFYHLLFKLSFRLKGLMLLFVPTFLEGMKSRLETKWNQVETYTENEMFFINQKVIESLTCIMSHDVNGTFTTLDLVHNFSPLVLKQWKFSIDLESFEELSQNVISPCVSQMMLATQDSDAKNAIHQQVLELGRDANPKIRKAVLIAIQGIANRLMEEYSMFYPEAVPVLAELKEDVNPDIESECDKTLRVIEKVVGEAVYEHFPKIE